MGCTAKKAYNIDYTKNQPPGDMTRGFKYLSIKKTNEVLERHYTASDDGSALSLGRAKLKTGLNGIMYGVWPSMGI